MNGRQEHQDYLEKKVKQVLNGLPLYMHDFSNSFGDKTGDTKLTYIRYVSDFITHMNNKGIDINDPKSFRAVKTSTINGYSEYIRYRNIIKDGKEIRVENGAGIRASRLYAISYFFEFLKDDGYININPCDTKKFPKEKKDISVVAMDINEINILKNNIIKGVGSSKARKRQAPFVNRDLAIVTLGLVTGLRVEALCEINVEDINFEENSLVVIEKGNIEKEKYIGQNTMDVILDWLDDRKNILGDEDVDALFISSISKNGKHMRITKSGVGKLIAKYTNGINKHITPHKLRSTCATTIYQQTGDIYLTADVLGHKNIQNTRRYASVAKSERQLAAQKLDNIFA